MSMLEAPSDNVEAAFLGTETGLGSFVSMAAASVCRICIKSIHCNLQRNLGPASHGHAYAFFIDMSCLCLPLLSQLGLLLPPVLRSAE